MRPNLLLLLPLALTLGACATKRPDLRVAVVQPAAAVEVRGAIERAQTATVALEKSKTLIDADRAQFDELRSALSDAHTKIIELIAQIEQGVVQVALLARERDQAIRQRDEAITAKLAAEQKTRKVGGRAFWTTISTAGLAGLVGFGLLKRFFFLLPITLIASLSACSSTETRTRWMIEKYVTGPLPNEKHTPHSQPMAGGDRPAYKPHPVLERSPNPATGKSNGRDTGPVRAGPRPHSDSGVYPGADVHRVANPATRLSAVEQVHRQPTTRGGLGELAPAKPSINLIRDTSGDSRVLRERPVLRGQAARVAVIREAEKTFGWKERTGRNDGPQIDKILASVGMAGSKAPYCAAWVVYIGDQTFSRTQNPYPRTAWSPSMVASPTWTRAKGGATPQAGDTFGIYFASKKRVAHTGLVERWGSSVKTCEANTSPDARSGSASDRDGGAICRKIRLRATIHSVRNWID